VGLVGKTTHFALPIFILKTDGIACHQMAYYEAKMHQIRLHWGSLQRSPGPLAGFQRPTSNGKEGDERINIGRVETEGKGIGKKERGVSPRKVRSDYF